MSSPTHKRSDGESHAQNDNFHLMSPRLKPRPAEAFIVLTPFGTVSLVHHHMDAQHSMLESQTLITMSKMSNSDRYQDATSSARRVPARVFFGEYCFELRIHESACLKSSVWHCKRFLFSTGILIVQGIEVLATPFMSALFTLSQVSCDTPFIRFHFF